MENQSGNMAANTGALGQEIKEIWSKLNLIFPTTEHTDEEINANDNLESPCEIVQKYEDEAAFIAFAQSKNSEWEEQEIKNAYQKIISFVAAVRHEVEKEETSADSTAVNRSISEISFTTFNKLVDEPWEKYCNPRSIESRISPVSYLTAILKIALNISKYADAGAIGLQQRRPDLFELVLNEESTYKEIKTIVLVNSILKRGIENYWMNPIFPELKVQHLTNKKTLTDDYENDLNFISKDVAYSPSEFNLNDLGLALDWNVWKITQTNVEQSVSKDILTRSLFPEGKRVFTLTVDYKKGEAKPFKITVFLDIGNFTYGDFNKIDVILESDKGVRYFSRDFNSRDDYNNLQNYHNKYYNKLFNHKDLYSFDDFNQNFNSLDFELTDEEAKKISFKIKYMKVGKYRDSSHTQFEAAFSISESYMNKIIGSQVIDLENQFKSDVQNLDNKYKSDLQAARNAIVKPDFYKALSLATYPLSFPFNWHYEKIKDALMSKKSSIREVRKAFEFDDYITKGTFYTGIPISSEQVGVLISTANDVETVKRLWDVKDVGELNSLEFFCDRSGLKSADIETLIFLRKNLNVITINDSDPKNKRLSGFNLDNLTDISKIIRLKKWFDLSLVEVCLLLNYLTPVAKPNALTKQTLHSIEYFVHFKEKYNLSVEDYVAFMNKIPVESTEIGKLSWFDKIFNKLSINLKLDNTNFDFNKTEGKDGEIVNAIMSGLKISLPTFQFIAAELFRIKKASLSTNIEDISALYRMVRIPRIFDFYIVDSLDVYKLLGYTIQDLTNYEKLYRIEMFSEWLKEFSELGLGTNSPATILNFFIYGTAADFVGSIDLLDFMIKANSEIDNIKKSDTSNSITTKTKEIAKTVFLPLLEEMYEIDSDNIELVLLWMGKSLVYLMNETVKLNTVKEPAGITPIYLEFHYLFSKYAAFINLLGLSALSLSTFIKQPTVFGLPKNALTLQSIYTLYSYSSLLNIDSPSDDYTTEEVILSVIKGNPTEERLHKLSKILEIEKSDLKAVSNKIGAINNIFKINTLYRLKQLFEKTELTIKTLIKFNDLKENSTFELFQSTADETIVEYSDALDEKKRDHLVDYYLKVLIPNSEDFVILSQYIRTPNDLYEYLLIDNQVTSKIITSLVASAIASIQQFINACILGIDPNQNVPSATVKHWLNNNCEYAVWSANVMLSLYPENYIEPSLRMNKSGFFTDVENDLSQARLDDQKIQSAVLRYLNKFEKVADLEVLSGYMSGLVGDGTKFSISDAYIHLVSKIRSDLSDYYVRMVDMSQSKNGKPNPFAWSDQEKIELPLDYAVPGTIRPVLFNSRLYIMYAEWEDKTRKIEGKSVPYDNLKLMVGYRTFDGTWSLPEKLVSVEANKEEFSDMKSFAFQMGDDRCGFMLASSVKKKIETKVVIDTDTLTASSQGVHLAWGHIELKRLVNNLEFSIDYDNSNKSEPFIVTLDVGAVPPLTGNFGGIIIVGSDFRYHGLDKGHGPQFAGKRLLDKNLRLSENIAQTIYFIYSSGIVGEKFHGVNIYSFDLAKIYKNKIAERQRNQPGISSSLGCIIDQSIERQIITSGHIKLPEGQASSIDSFPALKTAVSHYVPKMLQVNVPNHDSTTAYIPDITFETSRDGKIGTAQYLRFNNNQFPNYEPIRINTNFVRTLVAKASIATSGVFLWQTQNTREPQIPGGVASPKVDFNGANGKYFWELFFYLPFLISHRLKVEGNYKLAMEWLHAMFNPSHKEGKDGSPPYWKIRPLMEPGQSSQAILRPADPDAIAASNPIHYKKSLFYHMLDIIIAEADTNFRMLTPDSLGRAKQLYVQCLALLGKSPDVNFVNKWKEITLKNAVLSKNDRIRQLEMALLTGTSNVDLDIFNLDMDFTPAGDNPVSIFASIFRIPLNEKLLGYWDLLEGRLYNLRNSLNITGMVFSTNLFASPMNPKDLLRARGAGATSVLEIAGLDTKVPPYRYSYMLNQARMAVDNLGGFGDRLMSFLERRDDFSDQDMTYNQSIEMSKFGLTLQDQAIKIAKEELKNLTISQQQIQLRHDHYKKLYDDNVSSVENHSISLKKSGASGSSSSGLVAGVGSAAAVMSNPSAALVGLGISSDSTSKLTSDTSNILDATESFKRRREEWEITYKAAAIELKGIEQNIVIQNLQIEAANFNLAQQTRELQNLQEKYKFFKTRFTNQELYNWLVGQMSTIYLRMYDVALYLCLATEAAYRFEAGAYNTRFIDISNIWDNAYRGLNAGSKLKLNLEQMSMARIQGYERFLEIIKKISLKDLFGTEWNGKLKTLRETGEILFDFPEKLFAQDYPGHYYRQIYTLSVSLVGKQTIKDPETGEYVEEDFEDSFPEVHAILTQISNSLIYSEDTSAFDYLINGYTGATPPSTSYLSNIRSGQPIAISEVIEETGIAGVGYGLAIFDGDRYIPFEGTGLISKWHLIFTNEKQRGEFLKGLTDITFNVRYTSVVGSNSYKEHVKKSLAALGK